MTLACIWKWWNMRVVYTVFMMRCSMVNQRYSGNRDYWHYLLHCGDMWDTWFGWAVNHERYSMSGGPLVGSVGYRRWTAIGISNLVMFIWCDTDDGLNIVMQVSIGIIILNGIIWHSYGSVIVFSMYMISCIWGMIWIYK